MNEYACGSGSQRRDMSKLLASFAGELGASLLLGCQECWDRPRVYIPLPADLLRRQFALTAQAREVVWREGKFFCRRDGGDVADAIKMNDIRVVHMDSV